jgi:hypothetical protein
MRRSVEAILGYLVNFLPGMECMQSSLEAFEPLFTALPLAA